MTLGGRGEAAAAGATNHGSSNTNWSCPTKRNKPRIGKANHP
jgi:hypothetical protein